MLVRSVISSLTLHNMAKYTLLASLITNAERLLGNHLWSGDPSKKLIIIDWYKVTKNFDEGARHKKAWGV